LLHASTVAQDLAAFHGDPVTAHFAAETIWETNSLYTRFFSDRTTAAHIVFCSALHLAVQEVRRRLKDQPPADVDHERAVTFLARRGATLLTVAAIGGSLPAILGRPVNDTFRLRFATTGALAAAVVAWTDVIDAVIWCAVPALRVVFEKPGGLRDPESVTEAIGGVRTAIKTQRGPRRGSFATTCDAFAGLAVSS
jgi:hypothetical protein